MSPLITMIEGRNPQQKQLIIAIFGFPTPNFRLVIRLIITHLCIWRLLTLIALCVVCITEFLKISLFTCIGVLVLEARLYEFLYCPSMWESFEIVMVFLSLGDLGERELMKD
jgi:hypothetical protein